MRAEGNGRDLMCDTIQ